MRILTRQWTGGFLDQSLLPGSCRIQPHDWVNVRRVEDMYYVRRPTLRLLVNYQKEIGVRNVGTKIRSRLREKGRNQKWLSCGMGTIMEVADLGGAVHRPLAVGVRVVFVAPSHPRCMERIVLPVQLLRQTSSPTAGEEGLVRFFAEAPALLSTADALDSLTAWTPDSGASLDAIGLEEVLSAVEAFLGTNPSPSRQLPTGTVVTESTSPTPRPTPTACLIGYGNYAKTVILPAVAPLLNVVHIHELDPTQIGPNPSPATGWDTSPVLRPECHSDVMLVAGYHHTHATLAIEALSRGAAVVLEKPLVTTLEQLNELLRTMESSSGRLFACFQKRYLPFGRFIKEDLGVASGEPIDYHCIVYEEPLPLLHWYRWPNSRSRLTSNGCHWIDHFLFLNDFVGVRRVEVSRGRNDAVSVSMELENDAYFTMALTDRGSPRIGLQDHVELRSAQATVRISNSTRYIAERGDRVVRRDRARRLDGHAAMYKAICDAVLRGEDGDTARSVRVTAGAVLRAEEVIAELPERSAVELDPGPGLAQ